MLGRRSGSVVPFFWDRHLKLQTKSASGRGQPLLEGAAPLWIQLIEGVCRPLCGVRKRRLHRCPEPKSCCGGNRNT